MLGEAQRAHPAGIVRDERGGEAGEEPDIEGGVVGDHNVGSEGAYRGDQGGRWPRAAGLALHVRCREVMHGGGGGRDIPPGIDQAGMEGWQASKWPVAGSTMQMPAAAISTTPCWLGSRPVVSTSMVTARDGGHGGTPFGLRPGGTGRSGWCWGDVHGGRRRGLLSALTHFFLSMEGGGVVGPAAGVGMAGAKRHWTWVSAGR